MTNRIPNSIVNSNSTTIQDSVQPFSFLEFIKLTNTDYSPEEYNTFYLSYLKDWTTIKNTSSEVEKTSYVEYYVTFLKELVVVYSTQQELRFLSTIDFNNPLDLDVAIPFFTEKIRQIVLFYKSKRDEVKYAIDRNKIKGTSLSIEKGLFETIYTTVFNTENPLYTSKLPSLSTLTSNLKIDIEEFVDVYGDYFDIPTQPSRKDTGERRAYYSSNINAVDTSLFFDNTTAQSIFSSNVFLTEIPLAVNFKLSIDPVCDPTNPLLLQNTTQVTSCGLTETQLNTLRKTLISKYIGTDLYYISTVNETVSGVLIEAQAPYNNVRNLHQPNTASVQSSVQTMLKNVGLFFKPDNIGLFKLDTNKFTYTIDQSALESGKIYIFPDPAKYGNVLANNAIEYPLSFVYDYTNDSRNMSSGLAFGDPKVANYEQTFSPYYTVEQNTLKHQAVEDSLMFNFSDLFNQGYIQKIQYDIYGNEYALFKDAFGQTFRSLGDVQVPTLLSLLLNGHTFYDSNEGYNFDYSIASVNGTTIRSGLSTLTVDNPTTPSLTLTGYPYTLFFRDFYPYTELAESIDNISVTQQDGGGFSLVDGSLLPDSISADLSTYPSAAPYYYNILVDGGVSSLEPPVRGYYVGATYNADFTLDVKTVLSSSAVDNYDCGYFTDDLSLVPDAVSNIQYYDTLDNNSLTIVSSTTGTDIMRTEEARSMLEGKLYVKNQRYSNSYPIIDSLSATFSKYSDNVRADIADKVRDFEVFYDSLCIETEKYLLIDKIKYDGAFLTPTTKNTVFERSVTPLHKFSNRFFNESTKIITFCVIQQLTGEVLSNILTESEDNITLEDLEPLITEASFIPLSGNSKILLPTIYQYNITTNEVKTLYPRVANFAEYLDTFSLSDYFNSDFNISIVQIDKPIITYNSFNDVYKLTFTCTDNNNLCYIYDYEFTIETTGVVYRRSKFYKSDRILNTTDFFSDTDLVIDIQSINGTYTINTTTGVLTL